MASSGRRISGRIIAIGAAVLLCGMATVAVVFLRSRVFGRTPPPDAGHILFGQGYRQELYVMNADGSNARPVFPPGTPQQSILWPQWSPDGTRIAYILAGSSWQAYVMDADGSNNTLLSSDFLDVDGVAWSPDGSRLVMAVGGDLQGLFVISADGSDWVRITTEHDMEPHWSPDGTRIVFARFTNNDPSSNDTDLFTVRPDGSGLAQLPTGPSPNTDPEWSPDSSRIAYTTRNPHGQWAIYVINADGTNIRKVAGRPDLRAADPTWSPDGEYIAFMGVYHPEISGAVEMWVNALLNRPGPQGEFSPYRSAIYAVPASGGAPAVLYDDTGSNQTPDWGP